MECFQVFTVEYSTSHGFVVNSFYYVEICSLCTHFGKNFYHDWIFNFIECFFSSVEMIVWFLSILLLYSVSHWFICIWWTILVWFNPWMNPTLLGIWSFLCITGSGLLICCWEFLHLYSSKILAYNFLFFLYYLRLVLVSDDSDFLECLWSVPSSSIFWQFEKDLCKFFLACLLKLACETIGPWTFL